MRRWLRAVSAASSRCRGRAPFSKRFFARSSSVAALESAASAAEALAKLDGLSKVHLIVSDVNMPNMDGISFVTQVKQHARHKFTPVIMLTTETEQARMQQAKAAGARAWLVKPFHPPALLDAVSQLAAA